MPIQLTQQKIFNNQTFGNFTQVLYGRKPLKIGSKYWIEVVDSHSIVPRIAIMIITSFHACSELIFHSIRQNNSFKCAFLKFSLYPNVGNINVEMMQKQTLVTARAPLILGEKKNRRRKKGRQGKRQKTAPSPLVLCLDPPLLVNSLLTQQALLFLGRVKPQVTKALAVRWPSCDSLNGNIYDRSFRSPLMQQTQKWITR